MLRSVGAYVIAAALLLLSSSAFRQALSEFRDTEPGSLLFGVLQLVIGTSAVASAIGLVKRARWAAWPVAIWGAATAALLAVQPLFSSMDTGAKRSIWWAAAAVGVVAAGVSWFARRRATGDAASRASDTTAHVLSESPVLLRDGQRKAEPAVSRAIETRVPRDADGQRQENPSNPSRAPLQE